MRNEISVQNNMADSQLVTSPTEPSVYGQRSASGGPFIRLMTVSGGSRIGARNTLHLLAIIPKQFSEILRMRDNL